MAQPCYLQESIDVITKEFKILGVLDFTGVHNPVLLGGRWTIILFTPPKSNMFSDWRRMCHYHWSKRTNSLGKQQLELSTAGDQVVHLETARNLCSSCSQADNFLQFVSCLKYNNHLMTGPTRNSEFRFPSILNAALASGSIILVSWGSTVSLKTSH